MRVTLCAGEAAHFHFSARPTRKIQKAGKFAFNDTHNKPRYDSDMKNSVRRANDDLRLYDPHETARMESLAGIPLASFRARALAFLLDLFFLLLLYVPAMTLIQWVGTGRNSNIHLDIHFDFHNYSSLIFAELYFGLLLYFGKGQTPGKRVVGIRVVSLGHEGITLWQATERALGYGASMLEGGFGFIQYFIHRNHRCVHDRIAETIVVQGSKR